MPGPRVTFRIEGVQETVRNLDLANEDMVKKAQKVVRKTTNAVRREAKNRVPVSPANRRKSSGSPGDLKKSIRARYYFNNLGAMVLPFRPKGSHRYIVEQGTRDRRTKKGAYRGRVSPQPFMEPAKRSQEASYNAAMREIFEGEEREI